MAAGYQYTGQRELPEEFWKGISSDAPAPLEDGVYEANCIKAEPQPTKKDGKPSIKCTFKVIGAWGSDTDLNRTVFDNFTFEQEGAFKVKNFCESANVDLPGSTFIDELERLSEDMVGVTVWVHLGTREYKGKNNNTIVRYVSEDDIEEYVEKLKEGDRGTGEPPKRKSRAERAQRTRQREDEDEAAERTERRKRRAAPAEEEEPKRERRASRSANGASTQAQTEDLDDEDEGDAPPPQEEENPRRRVQRRRRAE